MWIKRSPSCAMFRTEIAVTWHRRPPVQISRTRARQIQATPRLIQTKTPGDRKVKPIFSLKWWFINNTPIWLFYQDTALKQQRLPAWQPILTAKTVLPLFFVVGVIFVVLGGVLLYYSNLVWLLALLLCFKTNRWFFYQLSKFDRSMNMFMIIPTVCHKTVLISALHITILLRVLAPLTFNCPLTLL